MNGHRTDINVAARELLDGVVGPALIFDDGGLSTAANDAAAALLGCARDELRGLDLSVLSMTEGDYGVGDGSWTGFRDSILHRPSGAPVAVDIDVRAVELPSSVLYLVRFDPTQRTSCRTLGYDHPEIAARTWWTA